MLSGLGKTRCFILTFHEVEFLKESGHHKGVTQVEQQPTEDQALKVQVYGVRPRAHVAHRHLNQNTNHRLSETLHNSTTNGDLWLAPLGHPPPRVAQESAGLTSGPRLR